MYENQTENTILKRMLENVPSDVDKREGSIVYDSTMPTAIEIMLMYAALDFFLKNTFGDTADRPFLVERAKERSLTPKKATKAKVRGVFTPANISVPIGSVFSYEDLDYTVTEKIKDGEYYLICNTEGAIGNQPAGKMIPNEYINRLETATLTEVTVPGDDEEDTEVFRARYLASFNSQAYGGNIPDYKEKVNACSGVGGCKVYPAWQGGGTVKVVFMTSEFKPPTDEFVRELQNLIDPVPFNGQGLGTAPVGHRVTVLGAENSKVAIRFNIVAESDITNYQSKITSILDGYFLELNKGWQNTKKDSFSGITNRGITIRISQIESRILAIDGITDIAHTELNGVEENLELGVDQLAVRGDIVWQ